MHRSCVYKAKRQYTAMMSLGGSNFASLKVGLEWQAERRFQASAGGVKRVTTVCHAEASSAVSSAAHTSGRLAVSVCFRSPLVSNVAMDNPLSDEGLAHWDNQRSRQETDLLSTLGEEVHLSLLVRNPEIGAWLQKIKTSEFPQDIFRSAPEHIRDNQEIALAVVSRHGFSLKFASHNLRDDRQVVLAAVQQTGAALAYASERLKAEKDMVLLAVKRHGAMLEHASQDLQSDREVVLAAVSNQARALRFAAEDLRADAEVVAVAALKDAASLAFVTCAKVLCNRGVMEPAVKRNPSALQYAGEELRSDRALLLQAIEKDPSALKYASEELRSHWDLMSLAQRNRCAQYAVHPLQSIPNLVVQTGTFLQLLQLQLLGPKATSGRRKSALSCAWHDLARAVESRCAIRNSPNARAE
eukprot:s909_g23.t1